MKIKENETTPMAARMASSSFSNDDDQCVVVQMNESQKRNLMTLSLPL